MDISAADLTRLVQFQSHVERLYDQLADPSCAPLILMELHHLDQILSDVQHASEQSHQERAQSLVSAIRSSLHDVITGPAKFTLWHASVLDLSVECLRDVLSYYHCQEELARLETRLSTAEALEKALRHLPPEGLSTADVFRAIPRAIDLRLAEHNFRQLQLDGSGIPHTD